MKIKITLAILWLAWLLFAAYVVAKYLTDDKPRSYAAKIVPWSAWHANRAEFYSNPKFLV